MPVDVTVITPSLADRVSMRERCIASVREQTVGFVQHLIGIDNLGLGPARMRNQLITAAETSWVACCDDDDWFLPRHLEVLLGYEVDVVVAWTRLETDSGPLSHDCDFSHLEGGNWFHPSSCLLRRSLVLDLGGFPEEEHEDWALWKELLEEDAAFACVHEVTNVKGVHYTNRTGPRL